jgi:phospholipid-translocating ATPase
MDGTSANSYEAGSWASDNIYLDSVIIFASCLIVFQNIVPISLYITIEIVKTVSSLNDTPGVAYGQIQAFFIFQDVEMYYEACKLKRSIQGLQLTFRRYALCAENMEHI